MVQAVETFTGDYEDVPFVVRKGETYASTHPIVVRHGQFFGPVRADVGVGVAERDPEKAVF